VLIALSWIYMAFGQLPAVAGILYGIKPAVVAIVVHAAWRIGSRTLRHPLLGLIAVAAFVAIFGFHVPFPLIVIVAAIAGTLGGRLVPRAFAPAKAHGSDRRDAPHLPAVIDDTTPTPPHARFKRSRLALVLGVCAGLWLAVYLAVAALGGGVTGTLAQMAWFFTKAALLTFGGAYAVLPYVYQGAVETFAWLSPAQMIDGLALGETTPGPLIMVVAFVGFVAAWGQSLFGAAALPLAGIAGACVATFFTFLPSFLFILAGGPLIESTHGNLALNAPLTGVTAAVVGVIVSLACFFALHVFWRGDGLPWSQSVDGIAVAIGLVATIALFRFKANVIAVIAGCGFAGWAAMRGLA
jgi:chromate transporter